MVAHGRPSCRCEVHATIPKGNLGYNQYTVLDSVAVEPTFVAFFKHSQTYVQIYVAEALKSSNSELKTTHNTFRDCRVRFSPTTFLEIAV